MPFVLTEASSLVCAHQGRVKPGVSQSRLTVNGARVLVEGDPNGAPIGLCATVADPTTATVKCLHVASADGGVAGKLKVGGKGVLLADIQGRTDGTVGGIPQTWSVRSAGQTRLKAV